MGKLLRRVLLVAVPFIVLSAIVVCVDPFDYFRYFSVVPEGTKYRTVHGVNPVLWDTVGYFHDPCPNIVIGDSRAQLVSLDYLKRKTGKEYRLLSATAAKLNEIVDYFWFADSRARLGTVYIVLNFNMFNYYAFANRVAGATAATRNPLLYVFNQSVLASTWEVAKAGFRHPGPAPSDRAMTKDQKWSWTLSNWAPQQYGKWKYPEREYRRLKEVGEYCTEHNIDLVIIIAPHHVDYQKKVLEYGLEEQQKRFKREIALVAKTFDFDYVSELTMSKDYFADPTHVTQEVSNKMMDEVLGGKLTYARLLTTSNSLDSQLRTQGRVDGGH